MPADGPPFNAECDVNGCTDPTEWVHLTIDGNIHLCRRHHTEGVSDRDRR